MDTNCIITDNMPIPFTKIGPNRYQLERTPEMRVDAVFYANDKLLHLLTRDRSLQQLAQTAELPELLSPVLGMPDMHEGYGIPVGGIIAAKNIISAGCVGMDINCGVRLLRTNLSFDPKLFDDRTLKEIITLIERAIPVGLGGQYKTQHQGINLDKIITDGAGHLVDIGYGNPEDLIHCEEEGAITNADPEKISQRAKDRARKQVGTLGSGNHFLELQRLTKVFDKNAAKTFGLYEDQICFMIHSGSRALGHQTCIDSVNRFHYANKHQHPELVPNHELASAYIDSPEGKDYLKAMAGCINFAFANRHMITVAFRQTMKDYWKKRGIKVKVEVVYDVAHNSAKWETHHGQKVLIHRKGATRALPPGHPDNPKTYIDTGHPAFIPGSMGTASFVLVGTEAANETYYSVNHGAGRTMSRKQAKQTISKEAFLKKMGSVIFNKPFQAIADEAPAAYKDVNEVITTLEEIGITKRVAQLSPLAVIKGD